MRVAIDYLPASTHPPGVGRYARELVRALAQLEARPEIVRCEFGRGRRVYAEHELQAGATQLVRRAWPRSAFELLGALGWGADRLAGGVDLVHQVRAPLWPVSRAKTVLAVSEFFAPDDPRERAWRAACARADALLVFSSWAREELARRGLEPAGGIHVVPVGAEHWKRDLMARPAGAGATARVLVLGRAAAAAMVGRLPEACVRLSNQGLAVELMLVWSGASAPALMRLGGDQNVSRLPAPHTRGSGPKSLEDQLPALVAGSSVLVHLAESPATPVTPLEALALGVPVIVAPHPTNQEALGGEARSCPPEADVAALADLIAAAVASRWDPAAIERRQALAGRFTWEANARATIGVWERVLAGRRS